MLRNGPSFLRVADRAKDVDCISRSAQGRDLALRP